MNNAISKVILLLICACLASTQITYDRRGRIIEPSGTSPMFPSLCPNNCCSDKTIKVDGSSVVQAMPDKARLNAQLTASGATVNQAIDRLASKVNQVISRLQANGLTIANYESTFVNVYANTSWNDGVTTILGQIANQNIAIQIPQISPDGSNIGKLIDSLAQVDGISINSLTFDIKDKTVYLETARERAFKKAEKKAQDYAELLTLYLGKVLSITDNYNSAPVVQEFQSQYKVQAMQVQVGGDSQSTNVNLGTIKISYDLNVVYAYA